MPCVCELQPAAQAVTLLLDVTPLATAPLFHLAFPVTDLNKARSFYGDILGCGTGRESERWIDFDFFGRVVAHLVAPEGPPFNKY